MNFDKALAFVLKWEGGEVNDPHDPGGHTKYGISKRAYPDLDIANLTLDDAKALYKRDYWDEVAGDLLPEGISTLVFDSAVNQGPLRATLFLQKALGVEADGIIGPRTIKAAQRANLRDFSVDFAALRAQHYAKLPTFPIYGRGWMRRLMDGLIEAQALG